MWIERLMAGISHQHVLSYNPKFPEIETLVNSGYPVYLTKNGYGANSLGGGFCICDKCYDNNKKLAGLCCRMRQRIMQKI